MSVSFADLSILLVEPSRMQARFISAELNQLGVRRITVAERGSDAQMLAGEVPPSVLISALYLPDMSGTDLVHALRADEALAGVAFILMSSETRPQVLDPVRQSGACAIVPKPFTRAQLAMALRATVDFLGSGERLDVAVDLENLRVLIVDDSRNSRRFIMRILGNLGIEEFLEAGNGHEAVAVLGETMVDLVITDYNMPEMDGRQLIEHIRQQSWQSSVPILMVTSEDNMSRLAAVEQAGVSAICDKPLEPAMIKRLIEQALAAADS